ncbi:MAG TPA: GntR family transcriptional regulator [Burkholderiaceae bacterium]
MLADLENKLRQLKPDPAIATPLYLQLASKLSVAVHEGVWKPNEALPAERILSEALGISRFTTRKAIEILCERGVLCRRHGSGTYVNRTLARPLSRLTSFSDEARQRGFAPGSTWLSREIGIAAKEECRMLGLRANSPVSRLKRLRTADDRIVAIESSTIPARFLPDPRAVEDSLYSYLADRQAEPARARQHIQAINANEELARLANVEPGSAMLYIRRIAYDARGAAIELTHSYFRSDRFDFVAVLAQDRPRIEAILS